jgi:hypothetical protein
MIIILAFLIICPLLGYLAEIYGKAASDMPAGPEEPAPAKSFESFKQWLINMF